MNSVTQLEKAQELPFYEPQGNEVELFMHAYKHQLPVLIKGPTGCGKTRFISYMAERLGLPLHTVACHDDLSASDLVGRHLIGDGETVWSDGPLTRAVREGGICYLDEVVEARKDTTVVIHPLTDDRRILPIDRTGETLHAPKNFMLVVSYNPGYQNLLKGMKPSTRSALEISGMRRVISRPLSRSLSVKGTVVTQSFLSGRCRRAISMVMSARSRMVTGRLGLPILKASPWMSSRS